MGHVLSLNFHFPLTPAVQKERVFTKYLYIYKYIDISSPSAERGVGAEMPLSGLLTPAHGQHSLRIQTLIQKEHLATSIC